MTPLDLLTSRIRAHLRRRREVARRKARDLEIRRLLESLTPELGQRYLILKRLEQDIRAAASETGTVVSELLAEELDKLEALLSAFLRLLMASLRYRQYLIRTDESAILKDIAHLRGKRERTVDPATRRIIEQNLDILHKRHERFGAIQRGYFHVQAQLEVVEDTFHLVSDQMVSLRAPDTLKIDLGQIISGVETTEAVLLETNALVAEPI